MKKIDIASTVKVDELLRQIKDEDVVLMQAGHAVALLSDFDDEDLEWYGREQAPEFVDSIARARDQVAQGKTVKHEDLKRQLGIE
jgi:PHD/YefM family antitoxin component YafN of YafNO toxin-antitoxin module